MSLFSRKLSLLVSVIAAPRSKAVYVLLLIISVFFAGDRGKGSEEPDRQPRQEEISRSIGALRRAILPIDPQENTIETRRRLVLLREQRHAPHVRNHGHPLSGELSAIAMISLRYRCSPTVIGDFSGGGIWQSRARGTH